MWRWLTTGFTALLSVLGVLLLDCTFLFFESIDTFELCVEADSAIPGGSVLAGSVLIITAFVLFGYAWIPHLIGSRRERDGLDETERALAENVHRLPDEVSGPVARLLPGNEEKDELSLDLRDEGSDNPATPIPLDNTAD